MTLATEKTGFFVKDLGSLAVNYDAEKDDYIATVNAINDELFSDIAIEEIIEESYLFGPEYPDRLFRVKFIASHLPEFVWTTATAYEETPENREKLIEAHERFRNALVRKDLKLVKEMSRLAYTEVADLENYSFELYYDSIGREDILKKDYLYYKPINYDDYIVEVHNDGRLVKLQHKDYQTYYQAFLNHEAHVRNGYPFIGYYTEQDSKIFFASMNHYFSLIDGEFILSR